jgi:predicted amidohydrolase
VVELCGEVVTIAVCYDVHFLASDAVDALEAASVLLFPSAWVEDPDTRDTRAAHLAPIARRFGLHVVNANWGEGVVRVPGQGGSCVLAPDGSLVARATPGGRIDVTIGAT